MKRFSSIVASLLVVVGASNVSADIIASQNFNGLTDGFAETFDNFATGNQLTNSGSTNSGGGGIDFATFFVVNGNSAADGLGPVTTTGDTSDFIGVNSFAGANSPDVSAANVPVASGTEHNFEFNDADGRLDLIFSSVNTTGFLGRTLTLDYWINDTGYEADDLLEVDINGDVVLSFGELELEANVSPDDGTANWGSLNVDLEALGAADNIVLTIRVSNNSGTENIFVDNIEISGSTIPEPGTAGLLSLVLIGLAFRRRRK